MSRPPQYEHTPPLAASKGVIDFVGVPQPPTQYSQYYQPEDCVQAAYPPQGPYAAQTAYTGMQVPYAPPYSQPLYTQPTYTQTPYTQPTYAQPTYTQTPYTQPTYPPQPTYTQTTYPQYPSQYMSSEPVAAQSSITEESH